MQQAVLFVPFFFFFLLCFVSWCFVLIWRRGWGGVGLLRAGGGRASCGVCVRACVFCVYFFTLLCDALGPFDCPPCLFFLGNAQKIKGGVLCCNF